MNRVQAERLDFESFRSGPASTATPVFGINGGTRVWKIQVDGLACLDLGSSTGGFTDCLLQRGANSVCAVDSGTNQLDYRLRKDPRVRVMENFNARELRPENCGGPFDFATLDLSFIRLEKIFPALKLCLKQRARWVALVKPQFEISPGDVPRGGVVLDEEARKRALSAVKNVAVNLGLGPEEDFESPLPGRSGNIEFLLLGQRD